jgi:anti-anti-sigma factor
MPAQPLRIGDEFRRPEIEVVLRPDGLPSYQALILLRGEHDLGTAEAIRVSLAPLFGDVLVDLGDCDFIDSTVIGALIVKAKELEREGHRLECVVPPERRIIARVLEIVQMRELVTIHERRPGEGPTAGAPIARPVTGGRSQ